jgi:excisionase family DNA binding protein
VEKPLTAQQVGELIGRSTKWVLAEAAAERIPSFKVGRAVRFRESEIEAWLQERHRGPSYPRQRVQKMLEE